MDTREHRPDLEALDYKRPGNLTDTLFPMLGRAVRQGTLYYQDLQADAAAQTGRTAGAAPTETTMADAKTTYNLENDEFIARIKIPDAEIAGLGGLDAAQQSAARRGKRGIGVAIEDLTVANILANGSVTYVDILASLIGAVDTGVGTLLDQGADGPIAFCCSRRIFSRIKRYAEIIERMKFTGVLPSGITDVRGISAAQLAAALNVDEVRIGPDTEWYTHAAGYQDRAALVVLPDGGMNPNETPQVGRTAWFSPDGTTPAAGALFECHSYYSEEKLSEMVDVRAYAEQHVLNPELIYGLDGIDELNAVITTTTTV